MPFCSIRARVAGDPGLQWVQARIGAEGTAYLASLPFAHRIAPPGGTSPDDDLLIVHASPTDVDNAVITEANPVQRQRPAIDAGG